MLAPSQKMRPVAFSESMTERPATVLQGGAFFMLYLSKLIDNPTAFNLRSE
jgi:hypothetical protein